MMFYNTYTIIRYKKMIHFPFPPILSHSLSLFLPTLPSFPSHLLLFPPPLSLPSAPPGDELENIIGGIRNEVKSAGMQDTRENCWSFFIERVRRQLKVRAVCVCVLTACHSVANINIILFGRCVYESSYATTM